MNEQKKLFNGISLLSAHSSLFLFPCLVFICVLSVQILWFVLFCSFHFQMFQNTTDIDDDIEKERMKESTLNIIRTALASISNIN